MSNQRQLPPYGFVRPPAPGAPPSLTPFQFVRSEQNLRGYFENAASEYFGRPLEVIQASRMSNGSYNEPKLAAAWYFWRRGEA